MMAERGGRSVEGSKPLGFGTYLKILRRARGVSQKELARQAEISNRHMNFVENGRADPSRNLVLRFADVLALSTRDANDLITVAGFSASHKPDRAKKRDRTSLADMGQQVLANHAPMPAFMLDRLWNVSATNEPATELFSKFFLPGDRPNYMRMVLAPGPMRDCIENWPQVAQAVVTRLRRRLVKVDSSARLKALYDEAITYFRHVEYMPPPSNDPFCTLRLLVDDQTLALNIMSSHLASAFDTVFYGYSIEFVFAADPATDAYFRDRA
jgi:transcriptional regulator with XRE-family HTH domain